MNFFKSRTRFKGIASVFQMQFVYMLVLTQFVCQVESTSNHTIIFKNPRKHPNNSPVHRRHNRNEMNEYISLKSKNSRTAFNSDYNLQRDYIAATVGKEVQLDCKIKNLVNDDDKIVWLKMPKGEVLTLNGNRVAQDSRIISKCNPNQIPCWSLIIKETRESDTGFYVCQNNAMQTKYIYLDIMVPPQLLTNYPVDRINVNQSTNAIIACEFYGKPEPLIKWFKYQNGEPKEIEKYRGHKTIDLFIQKDLPSEFECVADNSIPPTVSKKIVLNIQYPPKIDFLNSKVYQKQAESVIFDCNVQGNPKPNVIWFKNHTRIFESGKYHFEQLESNLHRLFINNLTENDFGNYYVVASNLLGKDTSKLELLEFIDTSYKLQISTRIASTKSINEHVKIQKITKEKHLNTAEIIISQIENNKNKNMKNSFNIEVEKNEENLESTVVTDTTAVQTQTTTLPHKQFKHKSRVPKKFHSKQKSYKIEEEQSSSTLPNVLMRIQTNSTGRNSLDSALFIVYLFFYCASFIYFD